MKTKLKSLFLGFKGKVLWDEPLSGHSSFKVGGSVLALAYPKDEADLSALLKKIKQQKVSHFIIGDGSNVLLLQKEFQGVMINLSALNQLKTVSQIGNTTRLYVGSGLSKQKLLFWSVKKELKGLEFLAGVPGQLGGGLYMNAGTHLGDFSKVVKKVYLMTSSGKKETLDVTEKDFSYRAQSFSQNKVILGAEIELKKGKLEKIKHTVTSMIGERKRAQPLQVPNCGSTFKNPPGKSAGKLIEASGLKGFQVGLARVSQKHANFIENLGGAKATDIMAIIDHVKRTVKLLHGIELEEEVVIVGS